MYRRIERGVQAHLALAAHSELGGYDRSTIPWVIRQIAVEVTTHPIKTFPGLYTLVGGDRHNSRVFGREGLGSEAGEGGRERT